MTANGYRVSFRGDKNALKNDCGDVLYNFVKKKYISTELYALTLLTGNVLTLVKGISFCKNSLVNVLNE